MRLTRPRRRKRRSFALWFLVGGVVICLAMFALTLLPPVRERLTWQAARWQAQVRRALNPPEEVVFVPQTQITPGAAQMTAFAALSADSTASPTTVLTASPVAMTVDAAVVTAPSTAAPTPLPSPTPLPPKVMLTGVVHEYQQFNNCGPANLAMALSFWGWQGDQRDTRAFLRPNLEVDDKNVSPEEMVAFVQRFTALRALTRVGGDLDLLKGLIAGGFPVLIEAGHHPPKDWWMGHYLVVNGYDDTTGYFTVQDSLINPDQPFLYEELASRWWRDFNYVYVLIYPPEREAQLFSILGPRLDEAYSYELAAQRALREIPAREGRDLFFTWFNLGSSRVGLKDYSAAAQAYDMAFSIYRTLSEEQRPYRLMWYQMGPYEAYYYTGRFQDVINLANTTFTWVGQAVLEESYYWRGMAYAALGQTNQAIADFQKAAALNPNYAAPRQELEKLGASLP
jgi:hypothetical protein